MVSCFILGRLPRTLNAVDCQAMNKEVQECIGTLENNQANKIDVVSMQKIITLYREDFKMVYNALKMKLNIYNKSN